MSSYLWACFAPPLMHAPQLSSSKPALTNSVFTLTHERWRRFMQLDRDPTPLLAALESAQQRRLGLYFEGLWHFFLEWDEEVDLLAHNLAVHDGDRTIGEFDCLYFCRERGIHVHLELAVKFYLGHRQTSAGLTPSRLSEWIGPNTRDQLDRKVSRLTEHQIQLSEHPAARPLLEALGVKELHKEIEIKGRLFQNGLDPLSAPYGYNQATPLAKWWPVTALAKQHSNSSGVSFTILDKRQWFTPINQTDEVARLPSEALDARLTAHFQQSQRALQVAALNAQGQELERFFVVPADWPAPSRRDHSSQS